ncbi:hypothetical protein PR202_ga18913 [Eleusine coracana subsp. coracana]|uniref:S-locus glycoprotein domain-containing protein n=1 Tax=Eleusine coracana subsp. coracana TaxID=191504 RepID=A0AAV5CSX4_ELECO|nr:hypothetical protein PR202_ga18913 [Eleusine coracana subsp. coracana]
MRLWVDYTGKLKLLSWNGNASSWTVILEHPSADCDLYATCGPFGYCDHHTAPVPTCQCLDGSSLSTVATSQEDAEALKCRKKSHFVTLPGMKVPDKFTRIRNTTF